MRDVPPAGATVCARRNSTEEIMSGILEIIRLGRLDYGAALELQKERAAARMADNAPDALFLVEHPPVLTQGRSGEDADVLAGDAELRRRGVEVFHVERGGKATFHGPGQLVAYPVLLLRERDLHAYMDRLLEVTAAVLRQWGLAPRAGVHGPGLWVNGAKIASVGIAVRKWVTFHGVALNVTTDLDHFGLINPCGHAGEVMTSMQRELTRLGRTAPSLAEAATRFAENFRAVFGYAEATYSGPDFDAAERNATPESLSSQGLPRPQWLRVRAPSAGETAAVEGLLERLELETVCQRAECPNMGECFGAGTATFMILGAVCTRGCRYCAVEKGAPQPPDADEPARVARAVRDLGLRHAVITSVTRDDLPDGGAEHFVRTVAAVRHLCPETEVEILVPDFGGQAEPLLAVCAAQPTVFNHNIETVRRLFPAIRPKAGYDRSLEVLRRAAGQKLEVKSGLMLGLGETEEEIRRTLCDLYEAGCRHVTLGQYLAPSRAHVPVARYVTPEEFARWEEAASTLGFHGVASGPLVRSSYRAGELRRHAAACRQSDGRDRHTVCHGGAAS